MSDFIYNLLLVIQEVAMADGLRSEGKIYVVVVVFLLILSALFLYLFRIEKTLYIGDDSRDCQAAYNSGCNSIFVGNKNELKELNSQEMPIKYHNNLLKAVPDIINFYKKI